MRLQRKKVKNCVDILSRGNKKAPAEKCDVLHSFPRGGVYLQKCRATAAKLMFFRSNDGGSIRGIDSAAAAAEPCRSYLNRGPEYKLRLLPRTLFGALRAR
jgi:hypothetical protein